MLRFLPAMPLLIAGPAAFAGTCPADPAAILTLDADYQAAVARSDAPAMERLLADGFVLVTGTGRVFGKADLLAEARGGTLKFGRQDDARQAVHFWGDTAVINALLTAEGSEAGKPFSYRLWFSDTYACTPAGWRYVFGQAAQPLPASTGG